MSARQLSDIKFYFEDDHIEFIYKVGGHDARAYLQLPCAVDSQHTVDDVDDNWGDEQLDVFWQLVSFYFSSFKGKSEASASACVGEVIKSVERVDGFSVAFAANSTYILTERDSCSYHNHAPFFDLAEKLLEQGFDKDELVAKAKAEQLRSLKSLLSDHLVSI